MGELGDLVQQMGVYFIANTKGENPARAVIGLFDFCQQRLLIGDADGVVVVAAEQAQKVYSRAVEQQAKENEIMQRIRSGEPLGRIFGIS